MNLVLLNSLCQPLAGDVDTLPAWSGMSPFFLQPSQNLVVSSEDVKRFFYTMTVTVPLSGLITWLSTSSQEAPPGDLCGRRAFLASRVLLMGFLN